MTFRWIDGFDYYSASVPFSTRYPALTGGTYGVAGRFGGFCFRTGGENFSVSIPATGTVCTGFAIRSSLLSSDQPIVALKASNSIQATLSNTSAGVLKVFRGSHLSGTLLGSASGYPFDAPGGAWRYVEFIMSRNATTGLAQVYFDGALVIDLNNVNTDNGSAFDTITLLTGGGTSSDLDDLYIADTATRVGERRVETLRPSLDASVQWVPDTGVANYARVNETQADGDTSYVSTATAGQKDLYGIGALSETPTTIDAVQVSNIARKTDSNSHTIRANLKSSATTANGTPLAVGSSYGVLAEIFATDPNGGGAWSAAAVNAAQIGPELVA